MVVALLVTLWVLRWRTGLGGDWSTARVRELVQHAGAAGVLMFVAVFSVGELLHVPGLVFVGAAVLAWGRLWGGALAWGAALVSLSAAFVVVRAVGGQPLGEVRWAWLRKVMARLDERPIATVALLRLVLWFAPTVNYALALSPVRYRDYLVGSALGLVAPVVAAAALLGVLFR